MAVMPDRMNRLLVTAVCCLLSLGAYVNRNKLKALLAQQLSCLYLLPRAVYETAPVFMSIRVGAL